MEFVRSYSKNNLFLSVCVIHILYTRGVPAVTNGNTEQENLLKLHAED